MDIHATLKETHHMIRQSTILKLLVIALLALALMIPVTMVTSLIEEREWRQNEVIADINAKWGRSQTVMGPVISIPFKKLYTDQGGRQNHMIEYLQLLPDTLDVKTGIVPEVRYRGIYESVLYLAEIAIECSFSIPEADLLQIDDKNVQWTQASIGIGISDMRGIKDHIESSQDGEVIQMNPGQETCAVFSSGIKANIRIDPVKRRHHFSFLLRLNGSQQIRFTPVGKTTTVAAHSTWHAPSFIGDFLPVERRISDQGFTAKWNVLYLNRNYPQTWTGEAFKLDQSLFGVKLFKPVDLYQKSMRTAKYAFLFIAFTFCAFFLSEILNRLRVHPVQYLLIGFALILFYTLLLSVSEHTSFNFAYVISALAVILLIALYTRSISQSIKVPIMIGGMLMLLYGYCFVLLQLEDYALVMGSLGLFTVLSAVMYLTRRIDWYAVHQKIEDQVIHPRPGSSAV